MNTFFLSIQLEEALIVAAARYLQVNEINTFCIIFVTVGLSSYFHTSRNGTFQFIIGNGT
jgi:hypothetical protein